MTETTPGRTPVQLFELVQPRCAHDFGSAPCTATGSDDEKCFKTFASCRDSAFLKTNFAFGTPLSLWFCDAAAGDVRIEGVPYKIPALMSVSTQRSRINPAGASPDMQGIGRRAVYQITVADFPHTDRLVDPYRDDRSWDTWTDDRGTYWSRWLARNPYRQNMVLRIYEGYVGQAIGDMTVRTYFLQDIDPALDQGRITFQGKDLLALIEDRKAQAPAASPGSLSADISAGAMSFDVGGAIAADYPAPGTVRIGSECMTYSAVTPITNGVTLTISERGTDRTTAAQHNAEDQVQWCLRYTDALIDALLLDLLTVQGPIPASYCNTALWASERGTYVAGYRLTRLITEPMPIMQLVGEAMEQATFSIWWNDRTAMIDGKAVRGVEELPPVLTEDSHIIEKSFSIVEKPRERVSELRIGYNKVSATARSGEVTSYLSWYVVKDVDAESDNEYGERSIKTIFADWITSDSLVISMASKIMKRLRDVPTEATFRLDAKDGRSLWLGGNRRIRHTLDRDKFGVRRERIWEIVEAEEVVPGEVIEYVAIDWTRYGKVNYVMANGTPDYPGAALAPIKNAYIGNPAGLLSDGEPCAKVA